MGHCRRARGVIPVLALLLVSMGLCAPGLSAQDNRESGSLPLAADVAVRLSAPAGQPTVGDEIALQLEVIHPADSQVILPTLGPLWGDFEMRQQGPLTTSANADGTLTSRQEIDVALFAPGIFQTPPLTIVVSDLAGNLSQASAAPVELTVKSVLADGDETLADIKPQASLPLPPTWPLVVTAAGFSVLIVGSAVWLWRRWRQHSIFDRRPAPQVALDELERIASLRLPQQAEFKQHYGLVTACLRRFLQHSLNMPALDRTTAELHAALHGAPLTPELLQRTVNLFRESDLVKFADVTPGPDAAQALVSEAQTLVMAIASEQATASAAPRAASAPRPSRV